MTSAIAHRGPDADGHWTETEIGIALGHRRLSILDLSDAGAQPMSSPSGRYVVSFNGEFYNWADLRRIEEQHGAAWRGHSDTEVFLAICDRLGVREAVERVHGMFALAIWDRQSRSLTLARDRAGEKPMFYGWANRVLLFGSELKALRAHSKWDAAIDRDSLTTFLRRSYIPSPRSIYRDVRKLRPGSMVTFRAEAPAWPDLQTYWSASRTAAAGAADVFGTTEEETATELESLLRQTISREMVADVPVGAFLSGGIDSSLVVALMQQCSSRPVRTFSVGFHEAAYDEAKFARAVAAHLKTDHTEMLVTPREALDVIPKLASIYDEPFADVSQIPTYLVASVARQSVSVALSGDGGDELFAGYDRYALAPKIWDSLARIPAPVRRLAARTITGVSPHTWDRIVPGMAKRGRYSVSGDRLHKLAGMLEIHTREELYRTLISHWQEPAAVVVAGREPPEVADVPSGDRMPDDFVSTMMMLDATSYLPDDIFTKVDRASMAVSLEARAPLVDHAVIEFAWRIPAAKRIVAGRGKAILRRILARHVPVPLFDRPKAGFAVPIDAWLRGPLEPWASDLLSEANIKNTGLFDYKPIAAKWREHRSGERNWQYLLWDVLMAQAWHAAQAA